MVNRQSRVAELPVTRGPPPRSRVAADSELGAQGNKRAPDTEMGPALRPTPLSPACGPRRTLNAWRLSRGSPEGSLAMSPGARAGAGSVGGRMRSEDLFQTSGGSATGLSARLINWFGNAGHRFSIRAGRQARPADRAPSRFQRSESCGVRRRFGFHSSTARHLTVASSAVPKSLRLSGCYPVHLKSQSPLSMVGECASRPSRATANRPTYPLSRRLPVDNGG